MAMRDLLLQSAGVLGLVIALAHGVLGETQVFARATIEPPRLALLLRLVWQAGAIAWAAMAALLIATPWLGAGQARFAIVCAAVAVFGAGAAGNAWASKGRHFGWMLLAIVTGLAIAGA
jgi:hypothetical protein